MTLYRPPLISISLSILGHTLVLGLMLAQTWSPLPEVAQPLTVSLVDPIPLPDLPREASERQDMIQAGAVVPDQSQEPIQEESVASSKEPTLESPPTSLSTRLMTQMPTVIESLKPLRASKGERGIQGQPIPQLPGGPSLFDQWMGVVEPKVDRWVGGSGDVNARVTLANGDQVCIKIRGSTTQELFNPWMSAAVPMTRLCGRARPNAVELDNLRLRARPKAR